MLPSRAASTWVWKLSSSASVAGVISGALRLARCAIVTLTQPDTKSSAVAATSMQAAWWSGRDRFIAATLPDSAGSGKRSEWLVLLLDFGIMRSG